MNATLSISPDGNHVIITVYNDDGSIFDSKNHPLRPGQRKCFVSTFMKDKGVVDISQIDMNNINGVTIKVGELPNGGGGQTVIIIQSLDMIVLPPSLLTPSGGFGGALIGSQQVGQTYQINSFPDIAINGKEQEDGIAKYITCYSKDEKGNIIITIYLLIEV